MGVSFVPMTMVDWHRKCGANISCLRDVTSVRQPKFMAPIYAARRAGSKAAKDTALDDADVQEASLPAWLGKILGEETTAA